MKSVRDRILDLAPVIIPVAIVIPLLFYVAHTMKTFDKQCVAKGGEPIHGRGSWLCVRPGTLIH